MAIPDYETLMLPVLQYVADGKEHPLKEITAHMAESFKLTAEEREQRLPSRQSTYIQNRTGWAKTYLKKAGLLASPKRGLIQITDRGREVLSKNPQRIDGAFLEQFP
jgi:restriction system protein